MSPPNSAPTDVALSPRASRLRDRVVARLEARGSYPSWVLLAALAGMFATTFPITILTIALRPIALEFGTRETTMAWVISAPMLFSAVALGADLLAYPAIAAHAAKWTLLAATVVVIGALAILAAVRRATR